jgi:hypothetical protein
MPNSYHGIVAFAMSVMLRAQQDGRYGASVEGYPDSLPWELLRFSAAQRSGLTIMLVYLSNGASG